MLRDKRETLCETLSSPSKKRKQRPDLSVAGPDNERFYCPFPGCKRSFAELWRLKVHYRAPPDVRGSGKERGHGSELGICPKCGRALFTGKHHVNCLPLARSQSFESFEPAEAQKRQRMDHASGVSRASGSDSGQSTQTGAAPTFLEPDRSLSIEGSIAPARLTRRSVAQDSFPSSYEGSLQPPVLPGASFNTRGLAPKSGRHWPLTEELIARAKAVCESSQATQAASCDLLATLAQTPPVELAVCPEETFGPEDAIPFGMAPNGGSPSRDNSLQLPSASDRCSFSREPVADRPEATPQPNLSHSHEPEASFLPRCSTLMQGKSWTTPPHGQQFSQALAETHPDRGSLDLSFGSTVDTGLSSSLDPGASCSWDPTDPTAWLSTMPMLDPLSFPPADSVEPFGSDTLFPDIDGNQEACSAWAMLDVFSTPDGCALPEIEQQSWFIKQEGQSA